MPKKYVISQSEEIDVFEDSLKRREVDSQRERNFIARQVRDQKFLQFVLQLLVHDRIFSMGERKSTTHFLYIDKITSPIYQETRDNLLKILSMGLIRYLFIEMKGSHKLPFPKSTISTMQQTSEQNQLSQEYEIEKLDILDCPSLEFSDVSLDVLTSLFNNRNINSFIMKEQKAEDYHKWKYWKNGDILLMFRIQQVLQINRSFGHKNLIFKDPLSIYLHGNHEIYKQHKKHIRSQREQLERQQREAKRQREESQRIYNLFHLGRSEHLVESKEYDEPEVYPEDGIPPQQKHLQVASERLCKDDIRPFLMFLMQNDTFVPELEDILDYPSMGFSHPLLLKWSQTSSKNLHYILPLLKTYHALFIDQTFTEGLINQFSRRNNSGKRMQNIQRHRRELAASLNIFRCLEEHYQRITYEPVFNRTASEKIFLQQCEQLQLRKYLIPNHRHCCEVLCSVFS